MEKCKTCGKEYEPKREWKLNGQDLQMCDACVFSKSWTQKEIDELDLGKE